MTKFVLSLIAVVLAFVLVASHLLPLQEVEPPAGHQVNLTVLTTDVVLSPMVELWVEEVQRRYHDAILIDGHGGTKLIDGVPTWCIFTAFTPDGLPVSDLIRQLRLQDPFRRIVLLCCNPDGLVLEGVNNVSYSLQSVWVVPDSRVSVAENAGRDAWYGDSCGDIFEFVQQ